MNSCRLARARQPHPLGQRHEAVVAARHHHPVLAGLLQLVAQHEGEIEHQRLFLARRSARGCRCRCRHGRDRAPRPGADRRWALAARPCAPSRPARAGCRPPRRAGRSRGRPPRDRAPAGPAGRRRRRARRRCSTRTGPAVSSTMREPPGITRPKRNALTRPRPLLARLGRQLEGDLRQVDDDPVGIGESEGAQVDLLGQIDHEPGLLVVAAEAGVGGDGKASDRLPRSCARAAWEPGTQAGARPASRTPASTAAAREVARSATRCRPLLEPIVSPIERDG